MREAEANRFTGDGGSGFDGDDRFDGRRGQDDVLWGRGTDRATQWGRGSGDLSGMGSQEAFRGKGMTHLEENIEFTVGGRSCMGGWAEGYGRSGIGQKDQLEHRVAGCIGAGRK